MNINLSEEEAQMLINVLESVSIQGIEGMKKVISLSEKLKKTVEGKKEKAQKG